MAILTVRRYRTSDGALRAEEVLRGSGREHVVLDVASVSWEAGTRKPTVHLVAATTDAGALGGSFWGLLFGLVFYMPLLGAAVGAAIGALAGSLADVGIDDTFVNRIRDQVTPGTSALFVLTRDTEVDRLSDVLAADSEAELISIHLSGEQEAALWEVFGETAA